MAEYIKNLGILRRGMARLAHLSDDEPIEFWLNGVETQASFGTPGVEGGDVLDINIEPNYTCPQPVSLSLRPKSSAATD